MTQSPERVKVLLVENVHPTARELLHSSGFEVESIAHSPKEAELEERIAGVHVLGIRSKTQVTPRVLAAGKDLLALGCFCIGTNQVDLADAHGRGIPVFNAPFSNTRSVAELILVRDRHARAPAGRPLARGARGEVAKGLRGLLRDPGKDARHRRLRTHRHAGRRPRRGVRDAHHLFRHRDAPPHRQHPLGPEPRRRSWPSPTSSRSTCR